MASERVPCLVLLCDPVAGPSVGEPKSHIHLGISRIYNNVKNKIERYRDPHTNRGVPITFHVFPHATLSDLNHALRSSRPYPLVCIAAASLDTFMLLMETEFSRESSIYPMELANTFKGTSSIENVIVLLLTCWGSQFTEQLLRAKVGTIVTTNEKIDDFEVSIIAESILKNLGYGKSVDDAVKATRDEIRKAYRKGEYTFLQGKSDFEKDEAGKHAAAKLFVKGKETIRLPLPSPECAADGPIFTLMYNIPA